MTALRLVCSPPQINPASARLCRFFPLLLRFHVPDSHRPLCTCLDLKVMPLNLRSPPPSPPGRTHLPVDAMAHLTLPLLEGLSFAPLINSSLLLEHPTLPPDDVMKAAYFSLKAKARLLILDNWRLEHPPPPYYSFPLALTPHPFMGVGKFMASRIYQMRAQKGYLAAHPSWSASGPSQRCPLCGEEQETVSHGIQHSPAKDAPRTHHLQSLTSVGPDAPLWSSVSLLSSLAAYIQAAATNYPMAMCPSLPPLPASMVFPPRPAASHLGGHFASAPPRPV